MSPKSQPELAPSWFDWHAFGTACLLAAQAFSGGAADSPPVSAPLSPAAELASFAFADPQLTADLVAAEPQIDSPVAIAWDADCRLFIAEMIDYPNDSKKGRVRLLEDLDGDGIYEQAKVFADQLSFPTGVLPWKDGLLVTAAPDILFLRDTDGDGKADERTVWLTGFGEGNQQLRVNGLYWGLDGWVYGANGRSDGAVRWPEDPPEEALPLRGHDFRFQPDSHALEVLTGRSQFGTARDDWGERFLSWNTVPVRHDVVPLRYLEANPYLPAEAGLHDLVPPDDTQRVYPLTPPPLTFNQESTAHFNALGGLTVYRGDALGESYRGNAFMGETLRNLVHRRVLEPDGVTFRARRGEYESEFLRATDPWFHPVNFATGPDGQLYVVDFYRRFVEHPDFVHGAARQTMPWREGVGHGRLWRIRRTNQPPVRPTPGLAGAASKSLVNLLSHPNGWQRDTAQRLLWERQDRSVVEDLRRQMADYKLQIANLNTAIGRLHSLYVLEGMGALDASTLIRALADPEPRVRVHALRLVESRSSDPALPELLSAMSPLVTDPDPRVRLQWLLTSSRIPGEQRNASMRFGRSWAADDIWFDLGWRIASGEKPAESKPTERAARSTTAPPSPGKPTVDRPTALRQYEAALKLEGDRRQGAVIFSQTCTPCHTLLGRGHPVGPDLSGLAVKPIETLLTDILDPNRQVAPEYFAYTVERQDGEEESALIVTESGVSVTLRQPSLGDRALPRTEIRRLSTQGKSLMPEGLEQGLTVQDLANLMSFLQQPDRALLPSP